MMEANALYRYALRRVGDHQHAEDLVQECLVTAWRKQAAFDGRSTLGTWLFGIMKFKVLDHLRASSRSPTQRAAHPGGTSRGVMTHLITCLMRMAPGKLTPVTASVCSRSRRRKRPPERK